jgi:hypothetical protein
MRKTHRFYVTVFRTVETKMLVEVEAYTDFEDVLTRQILDLRSRAAAEQAVREERPIGVTNFADWPLRSVAAYVDPETHVAHYRDRCGIPEEKTTKIQLDPERPVDLVVPHSPT